MANSPLGTVLNRLRTLLEPADADTTDRELLQRFVARREEAAFGELVRRGVVLSAGALAAFFTANEVTAAPPAALAAAALLAAEGGASTTAAVLAKGVIQAMWLTKIKTAALLMLALTVAGTMAGFGAYRAWEARAAAPAPSTSAPPPPTAEDKQMMPIDKAVIYRVGPVQGVQTDQLPDGAVVAANRPESVDDNVHLYLTSIAEGKKQKVAVPPGPNLAILAVGPVLNSPDEAIAVGLTRHGDKLDLEMAYTSAIAEGKVLKRNVPSRPLVQVPLDLAAGRYRLTVTWQARKSLPAGDAWNVPPTVATCDFTVAADARQESKAVRVKDVEFRAYVQKECPAPTANGPVPLDLGLHITNTTDKPLLFKLMDTVWVSLKSADGKELKMDGGRDKTRPYPPVTIAAGQSADVSRAGRLERPPDDKGYRLGGTDPSGFVWYFDGLRPGKYRLSLRYENDNDGKDQAQPYWVGKATTEEVEFEIAGP